MATTVPVTTFPGGPVNPPFMTPGPSGQFNLGWYGIDANDDIVAGATPAVLKDLPLQPPPDSFTVNYDPNYMVHVLNPLLRDDLPANLKPTAFLPDAIVTNRNTLKKMIAIFFNPTDNNLRVTMYASRIGDQIFFLPDGPVTPNPATGPLPGDYPKGYSIPFEEAISTTNSNAEYCFSFQAYRLLGVENLVVRCEVDGVTSADEIGDAKCQVIFEGKLPNPGKQIAFFKETWAQMVLGCTLKVYHGTGASPSFAKKDPAVFQIGDVVEYDEAGIAVRADLTTPDSLAPLAQLAQLLTWIRANTTTGQCRKFTYSRAVGITLEAPTNL